MIVILAITIVSALIAGLWLWFSVRSKLAVGLMVLATAILCIASTSYSISQRKAWNQTQQQKMLALLNERKELLELGINSDSALIRGLAAYIRLQPNLNQDEFAAFASQLRGDRNAIINFGAAPNMVIKLVYPLEGNEQVIGLNLAGNEAQRQAAIAAQHSSQIVIAGPVDLVQGGRAFIGRMSVHTIEDDGTTTFWGLVSAPISMDKLLEEAGIEAFARVFPLAIRGKDSSGSRGETFYGDSTIFENPHYISARVNLPQGSWELATLPRIAATFEAVGFSAWLMTWCILFTTTIILHYGFVGLLRRERQANELKESAAHAESGIRSRAEFIATMSHEIRTPMNGIIGMTEILMEGDLNDEQRDALKTIKASGDSLLIIINDILDISKVEAGKMSIEQRPFNIREIITDTIKIFTHKIDEKDILLEYDIAQDVARLSRGDAVRFRQVLMNMVGNAIKFTDKGYVRIICRVAGCSIQGGQLIRIEVQDTGIGFTPEQGKLLFNPFTQAEESTTRKFGGTGLGLSISKKLIDLMSGEIGASPRKSGGSSFWFQIPFGKVDESDQQPSTTLRQENKVQKKSRQLTILVAEDNAVNAKVLGLMLDKMGHYHVRVADGIQAHQAVTQQRFDAVLMDMQMPNMDGIDATKTIRSIEKAHNFAPTYIVALTANAMTEDHERCLKAGMNDFITKPITKEALEDSLAKVESP